MSSTIINNGASSRGTYFNTGNGPSIQILDIGHPDYVGLVDPDTAFWSLLAKDKVGSALTDGDFLNQYNEKRIEFADEMEVLRFGLKPSAVYFNPTDRCNLNCKYCYIPEDIRRDGDHMPSETLLKALGILKEYFKKTVPEGILPQIVFHGAEPMLNRESVFTAIDAYAGDFRFGVQTNGTLLDDEAIEFLTSREVSIGLSLDGHIRDVADRLRVTWNGDGVSDSVVNAIHKLKDYPNYSVICTVTGDNMSALSEIVDYFHSLEVPYCMLNPVRCTQPGARTTKPADHELAAHFLKALDRTYELYQQTGRKLIVANFSNVLIGIVAPTARRLMCDISPCGGGRCFFAVSANGDMFPCSEFIGLQEFRGGNLLKDDIDEAIKTPAFRKVTERKIEDIEPCAKCAIRHFCGSPCPAEAHEMNGGMDRPGAFCELYEEQVRYALRLIADGKENAYLWDGWDSDTSTTINITTL
ncbi:MAG: peptide-modifying radical SAM enzyme CbpB [Armatimonadota bacterium]